MKLKNNGRLSSIKRTTHINIRSYFITDRVTKQESYIEFCPTLYIIGGYFTKELQGYQFRCFRNIIIDIHDDDIPSYDSSGISLVEEQKVKLEKLTE